MQHNQPDARRDATPAAGGSLADDTLAGVEAIASFIGETPRRTFYLLSAGQLPAFKRGRTWRARKSTLLRHIAAQEEGAA